MSNDMFDKYKDRGHLIQKQDNENVPLNDRAHLLQSKQSDQKISLKDRGHLFQDIQHGT